MTTRQIHAFAQLIDQLPVGVQESEFIDGAVAANSGKLGFSSFTDSQHFQYPRRPPCSSNEGCYPQHDGSYGVLTPRARTGGEEPTGFVGYGSSSWDGRPPCFSSGSLGGAGDDVSSRFHHPVPQGNHALASAYDHGLDKPYVDCGRGPSRCGGEVGDCSDSHRRARAPVFDSKDSSNNRAIFAADSPAAPPSSLAPNSCHQGVASYYAPPPQRVQQHQQPPFNTNYCTPASHGHAESSPNAASMHAHYHSRNDGDRDAYRLPGAVPGSLGDSRSEHEIPPCGGYSDFRSGPAPRLPTVPQPGAEGLGNAFGSDAVVDNGVLVEGGFYGSSPCISAGASASSSCVSPYNTTGLGGHINDGFSLDRPRSLLMGSGGPNVRSTGTPGTPAPSDSSNVSSPVASCGNRTTSHEGDPLHPQSYAMSRPMSGLQQASSAPGPHSCDSVHPSRGSLPSLYHAQEFSNGNGGESHTAPSSGCKKSRCYSARGADVSGMFSSGVPLSSYRRDESVCRSDCRCGEPPQEFSAAQNFTQNSVSHQHRYGGRGEDRRPNDMPSGCPASPPSLQCLEPAGSGDSVRPSVTDSDPAQQMPMSPFCHPAAGREEGRRQDGACGNGQNFIEATPLVGACNPGAGLTSWPGTRTSLQSAPSSCFGPTPPFFQNPGNSSVLTASGNTPVAGADRSSGAFGAVAASQAKHERRHSGGSQHPAVAQESSLLNAGSCVSSSSASTFEGNSSCGSGGSRNGSPVNSPRQRSSKLRRPQSAVGRSLVHRRVSGASTGPGPGASGETASLHGDPPKNGHNCLSSKPSKNIEASADTARAGQGGGSVSREEAEGLGGDQKGAQGCGGGAAEDRCDVSASSAAVGRLLSAKIEGVSMHSDGGPERSISSILEGNKGISASGSQQPMPGSVEDGGPGDANKADGAADAKSFLCERRRAVGDGREDGRKACRRIEEHVDGTHIVDALPAACTTGHAMDSELRSHTPGGDSNIVMHGRRLGAAGQLGENGVCGRQGGTGELLTSRYNLTGKDTGVGVASRGDRRGEAAVGDIQGGITKTDSVSDEMEKAKQGNALGRTTAAAHETDGDDQERVSTVVRALEEELNKVSEELREVICQREEGREFFQNFFFDRKQRYLSRLQEIRPFLGSAFNDVFRAVTACRTVGQLSTWVAAFDFSGAATASPGFAASRVLEVFNSGAAAPLHVTVDGFCSHMPPSLRTPPAGGLDWDVENSGAGVRVRKCLSSCVAEVSSSRDGGVRGGRTTSAVTRPTDAADTLLGYRACCTRNFSPTSFVLRVPSLNGVPHLLPFTCVRGDENACDSGRADSPLGVRAQRSTGAVIRTAVRTRGYEAEDLPARVLGTADSGSRHIARPPRVRLCSLGDSVGEEEDNLQQRHPPLSASSPMDVFSGPGGLVESLHKGVSPRTTSLEDHVASRVTGSPTSLFVPFIDFECGPASGANASRAGSRVDTGFWSFEAVPAGAGGRSEGVGNARDDCAGLSSGFAGEGADSAGAAKDGEGVGAPGSNRGARSASDSFGKASEQQASSGGVHPSTCHHQEASGDPGSEAEDATAPGSPLFEKASKTDGSSIEAEPYSNAKSQSDRDSSGSPGPHCEGLPPSWHRNENGPLCGKSAGMRPVGDRDSGCAASTRDTDNEAQMGESPAGAGTGEIRFDQFDNLNRSAQSGSLLSTPSSLNGPDASVFGSQVAQPDWSSGSYRLQKLISSPQLR
ncbi:hypothetical protein BESB_010870 [Besnoitia besnoiti]|uniref:Uncharacterized protein n=1 Tax=Besnoitia besnoiti TaxID=94643 RepID=A0A2A9ML51_BESBE|nr:hypothetical protein BESB_010870 [Besnoitia besnoiti]PFH38745.1 hypothetical protein BESB_010870 [Besnoitia besnoiti]